VCSEKEREALLGAGRGVGEKGADERGGNE